MTLNKSTLLTATILGGTLCLGVASFAETNTQPAAYNPDITSQTTTQSDINATSTPAQGVPYPATDVGPTPFTVGVENGQIPAPASWNYENNSPYAPGASSAEFNSLNDNNGYYGSANPQLMGPTTVTRPVDYSNSQTTPTNANGSQTAPSTVTTPGATNMPGNTTAMPATTGTGNSGFQNIQPMSATTVTSMPGDASFNGSTWTIKRGNLSRYMVGTDTTVADGDVDFRPLSDARFTYYDFENAKSAGLSPSQMARAAAIADKASVSMSEIVDRVKVGATFPQIAGDYGIAPSDLRDVSKYQDWVTNYVTAYETTGHRRLVSMAKASDMSTMGTGTMSTMPAH